MIWRMDMKIQAVKFQYALLMLVAALTSFLVAGVISAQEPQSKTASSAHVVPPKTFATPEEAAKELVAAADKFDTAAFEQILGSAGKDLVITTETPNDQEISKTFAELAHEKQSISIDPKNPNLALILVGNKEWPFAVPLVKKGGKWSFDQAAGREELVYRRIGSNELATIQVLLGIVEAQDDYAEQKHDGSEVNQFAQRIISTPGKQDGLAWQTADGAWAGPVGENVAKAIEKGYTDKSPYLGYYYKILKGQGPAAPLGEMNYFVGNAMIGGFAVAAAPAEYSVTGVKTFIVSDDGVVYEKDFGPTTAEQFKKLELFNPDKTWTPVDQTNGEDEP